MRRQRRAYRRRDAAGEVERSYESRREGYRRQASALAVRRNPVIRRWR